MCNYSPTEISDLADLEQDPEPGEVNPRPTLHEILIQEKLDFEAKVQRAVKRRMWLRGIV